MAKATRKPDCLRSRDFQLKVIGLFRCKIHRGETHTWKERAEIFLHSRASVLWGCTLSAGHTDWLKGGDLTKDFQMLFMRKSLLGEKKDVDTKHGHHLRV